MSYYTDLIKACSEKFNTGKCIVLEIFSRAVVDISFISAETSIVISQACDSSSCKSISNHSEWLMLKDFFITVLLSAACYHNENWSSAAISFREHKSTIEGNISIYECDFLCSIWERALRCLGALRFIFAWHKSQRQRHARLLEGSYDLLHHIYALVAGSQRWYLDRKSSITLPFDLNRNPFRSLIRGIHGRIITIQMKDKREFCALYIKFAGPSAGLCVCLKY